MGVGGVAGDVADDAEVAFVAVVQGLLVDEGRDFFREVDAVDEDVGLDDLGEGAALGRFCQVPFQDVLVWDAGLFAEVDGASAAAAEGTDHQHAGFAASARLTGCHLGADVVEQEVLVGVGADGGHGFGFRVLEMVGPCLDSEGGACVACVVAECCYAAAGVVGEEFEVEERAAALGEAGEDIFPAGLAFVAVGELDVRMFEGEFVFGELFEADDDVVGGCIDPAALGDERGADSFELGVVKDALLASLHIYRVACLEELLGGRRRYWGLSAVDLTIA